MYSNGFRITQNTGNNSFSYDIRKQKNPDPQVYVTNLIEGSINDVHIGDKIVFEEIDSKGQIQSFTGLKNFVKLNCAPFSKELSDHRHCGAVGLRIYNSSTPIYILDNHNHALFFRYQELFNGNIKKGSTLIHIDQHTDMNDNLNVIAIESKQSYGLQDIFHFTNYKCNVGNFIQPAIQDGLIYQVLQINTEYKLLNNYSHCEEFSDETILNKKNISTPTAHNDSDFILDIDLDFRHPQMGIEQYSKTIEITKNLISQANLVTIATSPYFMNQILSIKILKDIFS